MRVRLRRAVSGAQAVAGPQPIAKPNLAKIRLLESEWVQFFTERDATDLVNLYTADGEWMAPNAPLSQGHDAITQRVDAAFAAGAFVDHPAATQTITVAASGDIASVVGTYKVTVNGTTVDIGKFVHVLRHTSHGWRIVNDIFNSDLPIPAMK